MNTENTPVVSFSKRNKFELVGSSRGPGLVHSVCVGWQFRKGGVVYRLTELTRTVVQPIDADDNSGYAPHVMHVYGLAEVVA